MDKLKAEVTLVIKNAEEYKELLSKASALAQQLMEVSNELSETIDEVNGTRPIIDPESD